MDEQPRFLNLTMNVKANQQPHSPPYKYNLQSSNDEVNIFIPVQYCLSMQV